MLLRGGKTVKGRKFLQDFKFLTFIYIYLNVCNFHLSISFVDVDLRSVCVDFSLDSVRIGWYAIFANVLENRCMDAICYRRSRTCFSSFHGTSDSPPVKGLINVNV